MGDSLYTKFFIRTMYLIYVGYIVIGIILLLISIYLWGFDLRIETELSKEKEIILGVFVVLSTLFSQIIYRKTINRIKKSDQLLVKIQTYQSAVIYRLSILEFTLIITVLFFLFTKIWSYLIIGIALLFLMIMCKPSKKIFKGLFTFSSEEFKSLSHL